MRVEVIEDAGDLEIAWKQLERGSSTCLPFQSWSWNHSWTNSVLPKIIGSGFRSFLAVSDAGNPQAVIPCFSRRMARGMIEITQLLGHRMSFINDFIYGDAVDEWMAGDILRKIRSKLRPNEFLHLRNMNDSSPFTRELVNEGLAEVQCGRLIIERDDRWIDPLDRLSKNHRKSLRWKDNKLRKQYGASYRAVPISEFESAFQSFIRLHLSRFEHRKDESLLKGDNQEFLHRILVSLAAEGKSEIFELCAGGHAIASLIAVIDRGRYFFVNSGFDMNYANFSPVKLLLTSAMRRAFTDLDCRWFELGPDYEAYKHIWQPTRKNSYSICLSGSGLYSRMMAAAYRAAFRRAVGG